LATSLESRFGESVAIKPGRTGQFDVLVDSRMIFSKSEVGRFPVEGEVEERFAALKAGNDLPPIESKGGALRRAVGKLFK